jgi:hypothetical protein
LPTVRAYLRGPPPFALAYVSYTHKLEEFVEQLSRVMTLRDVAELGGLCWDAVKEIAKRRLRRDYGRIAMEGVRYLSIDEIYVGKSWGYYTLVLDLESGRILWAEFGAWQGRFAGLLATFAAEPGPDCGGVHGYERSVLGKRSRGIARRGRCLRQVSRHAVDE